jgi:Flp pilus assembly protein TadD
MFAQLKNELDTSPGAGRLTDEYLEPIYVLAHGAYRKGDYEQAAKYFAVMAVYRPTSRRVLMSLAASQFMVQRYDHAASTYGFLNLFYPDDAEILCRYGKALILLGETAGAKRILAQAAALPGSEGSFSAKAKALLDLVES